MPTRILDQRETDLETRAAHLQNEITRFSDHQISTQFETRLSEIDQAFDEIEIRRNDVETHPDDDELYQRYLSKLLSTEADIAELELVLTHLELYFHHRDYSPDRVQRTEAVCEELIDVFDLTAMFLPVIRENYALLPLLERDYYVIYIPRGRDIIPTIPILAHEVAHAILDQQSSRSNAFNERIRELREKMTADRTERDFHENWNHWYDELFCDITGFFAFGPSYVYAQIHHLLSRHPYHIQRNVETEDETLHPPDALRFEIVTDLAGQYLPEELQTPLAPVCQEYRDHLQRYVDSKPSFYEDWVDEELITAVINDGKIVNDQLDQLCQHLIAGTHPSDAPDFEYRIKANQYWLEDD